jgi:hypothetical protein
MIRQFLNKSDARTQNPAAGRGKAGIRWYLRPRVEAAEQTPEFAAACRKADSRSLSARNAAERRAGALLEKVERIPITVPFRKLDDMRKEAREAHNERKCERDVDWDGRGNTQRRANKRRRASFIDRITVNYIRHELTNYDAMFAALKGQIGRDDAIDLVRDRVLDLIAEAYPDLATECRRQSKRGYSRRAWRDLGKFILGMTGPRRVPGFRSDDWQT